MADDVDVTDPEVKPQDPPPQAPAEKSPGLFDMLPSRQMMGDLSTAQRTSNAQREQLRGEAESTMDSDRARIERAFNASSHGAERLQSWNDEAQSAKFHTDPLQAFGSVGSVFGIIASAFTHAPMANALDASAAAMNAVREGDEKGYNRAFKAWQENQKLAEQRHRMEHETYQDAIQLAGVNQVAYNTKMRMAAERFGDTKALVYLENGMDKELNDMITARATAMEKTSKASEEIFLRGVQREMTERDPLWQQADKMQESGNGDPYKIAAYRLAALQTYYPKDFNTDVKKEVMGKFMHDHPTASAEEIMDFAVKSNIIPQYHGGGASAGANIEIERRAMEYQKPVEEGGKGLSPGQAWDRAAQEVAVAKKAPSVSTKSDPATQNAEIKRRALEYQKPVEEGGKGLPATEAYNIAAKEVHQANTVASGNRIDDIQRRIDQIDNVKALLDKNLKVLHKYAGAAGLAGRAGRLVERVENIFGSNQTDREQFMRDVQQLKTMAPRILNDSQGKPLSAEAGAISDIIAGLNMGDLTKNTIRAYEDLLKQMNNMQEQAAKRQKGVYGNTGAPSISSARQTGVKRPWDRDVVVAPPGSQNAGSP